MAKEKPNYGVTDQHRRDATQSTQSKASSMLMDIDGSWRPCPGRAGHEIRVVSAGKRIRVITRLKKTG